MVFINATLSRNQLCKHKNLSEVSTTSKQDDVELFSEYIYTSFY